MSLFEMLMQRRKTYAKSKHLDLKFLVSVAVVREHFDIDLEALNTSLGSYWHSFVLILYSKYFKYSQLMQYYKVFKQIILDSFFPWPSIIQFTKNLLLG